MRKATLYALLITIIYGCGSNDRGELVGVKSKKWFSERPFGMVSIPSGSFTMGRQDEDITGTMSAPARTVSLSPFFMDETEISNAEYKQFVSWVKDSIVRVELADMADFASGGSLIDANGAPITGGVYDFSYAALDTTNANAYQKYMLENYYDFDSIKPLSWENDILWDTSDYPDEYYTEVMDSLYIKKEDARNGIRTFNSKYLNVILRQSTKKLGEPNEHTKLTPKLSIMKKLLLSTAAVVAFSFVFTSCGLEDAGDLDCQTCYEQRTDAAGNITYQGNPTEYCSADLQGVQGQTDTDIDGNKIEYVCQP